MVLAISLSPSTSYAESPRLVQLGLPAPQNNVEATQQPYTLGVGDRIAVELFDLPEFSGDYQIPVGGTLNLPLIGEIYLEDLTLEQASNQLRAKYLSVLKDPIVTVMLITPRPLNVSVLGEVHRPGSYAMELAQAGEGQQATSQYPTLTQALERAGGITLAADLSQVQVRRRYRNTERIVEIDLQAFLQTGLKGQDIQLRDGDTIFVPTSTTVNLAQTRQLGTANFAVDPETPRTVAIVGEVSRPGVYVVIGGDTTSELRTQGLPTISRAIQLAGGVTPQADIRRISIRRPTQSGTEQVISVNLWQLLQAGNFDQNSLIQSGDTIIVPTADEMNPAEMSQLANANFSPQIIQVVVVGEVSNRPGTVRGILELPSSTTLNQALLAAGGFNGSRANRETVKLIRLNSDGTISSQNIKVDFSQSINQQTNPLLRNNDTIVVSRSLSAEISDTLRTPLEFAPQAASIVRLLEIIGVIGE
jgi:polysaccharide export outer membrane protein